MDPLAIDRDDDDEELYYYYNNYFGAVNIRRPRVLRHRPDYFVFFDDLAFKNRFRFKKQTVEFIYNLIRRRIDPNSDKNHAVPGINRLLLTLRFYATGSIYATLADFSGISVTSAHDFIEIVTIALAELAPEYIYMPRTEEEIRTAQFNFFQIASFPRVIGAIDCTHVRIESPGGDNAEWYRNRKGYFSLNVQTVSDHKLKIIDLVASWPGSSHDSNIFANSSLMARLEAGHFGDALIVGDSGYPNRRYMVTPLLEINSEAENLYNESQIRTRNVVERQYGVWKRRFPILSIGMRFRQIYRTQDVVAACAVLHNIAIDHVDEIYFAQANENDIPEAHQRFPNEDVSVRNALIRDYFETLL